MCLICNSGGHEMQELKRRLLETEAQMTSILAAMEAVQKQTLNIHGQSGDGEEIGEWQEEQVEEVEVEVCLDKIIIPMSVLSRMSHMLKWF